MQVLKINANKVKIILTKKEVADAGIDTSALDFCNAEARGKVLAVLDEVKRRFGFDHTGAQLLVQLFPLSEGGAELFVTRLGELTESKARSIARDADVGLICAVQRIWRFDSLCDSERCAAALRHCGGISDAALMRDDGGGYYLIFYQHTAANAKPLPLILYELGTPIHKELCSFIMEHAELISRADAADRLFPDIPS